jgi:NAD(P)-dependent dehydrogenase (short-subunit alcohol dehydrogenase family)
MVCDVADPSQVAVLRERALDAFGAVHLLCNNAGVANGQPTYLTPPAVWQWVVGVNLLGPAYGVSAFAPLMVEQGVGHIVNTASEAGLYATPLLGSYHPTKYGVVGLSEALSMELEGTGVGVSCLCPELVNTRIFNATRNAPAHLGLAERPAVDMGLVAQAMGTVAMDPADVAAQVAFAVKANQFWILTHQVTVGRAHLRNQDLELGRRPQSPHARPAT